MKKIYLVMTDTGTTISKIIRRHTGNTYNHISISLREDLSVMYSFGRRNPYLFFFGGFVIEGPTHGTFKRFQKTTAKVYELEVSDHAFSIISDCIAGFITDKKRFGYNFRGIWKARKKIDYQKSYRRFYCSQFVNYLLVCAHVIPERYFGAIVTPEAFGSIEGAKVIYEGRYHEYAVHRECESERTE